MQTIEVKTAHGTWTVRIRDDGAMSIVDDLGRERSRSQGHGMAGAHLAMLLANSGPLASSDTYDEFLRQAAQEFIR